MLKHKHIGRIGWVTLVVSCMILFAGSSAHAALIAAGNFAGFAPPVDVLPGGTPAIGTVAPLTSPFAAGGPGGISGTMDSYVFAGDPGNPWAGAGGLTFVFQVHVTGSPIDRFTSNDFTGFQTDVVYANLAGGDIAPTKVTRPTAATVGWNFDSFVTAGQETSLLVVRTDATQWTVSNGNVIDGQVASAVVYGPFNSSLAPEPTSLMLLAGFGMLSLRRRK